MPTTTATQHQASEADRTFCAAVVGGAVTRAEFRHPEHLRFAYTHLCEAPFDAAFRTIRAGLRDFLRVHGAPAFKFHESITHAWAQVTADAMDRSAPADSFDTFLRSTPDLLDTSILLTHFRRETLFSDDGRRSILAPDLAPFGRATVTL